jgi:hypothetical protein
VKERDKERASGRGMEERKEIKNGGKKSVGWEKKNVEVRI